MRTISLSLLVLLIVDSAAAQTFGPPVFVSTSQPRPSGIAAADFDNDGDTDLALSFIMGMEVHVFRNDGVGDFTEGARLGTGMDSRRVFASDLDSDGTVDLLTADRLSSRVSVLFGNPAAPGGFEAAVPVPAGVGTSWVTAADLDGDGDRDLAAISGRSLGLELRRNLGRSFDRLGPSVALGGGAFAVEHCDMDLDGDPDLVTTSTLNGAIRVFSNDGFGDLRETQVVYGSGPAGLVCSDLDGDGLPEVVVTEPSASRLLIFANDGGLLTTAVIMPLGIGPRYLALGDVDDDGIEDLVVTDPRLPGAHLLFGLPDGSFDPAVETIETEQAPEHLALADFDGDGLLDLSWALPGAGGFELRFNEHATVDCEGDPSWGDADFDGICDDLDLCPDVPDPMQEDSDGDGFGDACDVCPFDPGDDGSDLDGVCDDEDNCVGVANPDQEDLDLDGFGDLCDPCPADPLNDADGDGLCADEDLCPGTGPGDVTVPTVRLGVRRWVLDGSGEFVTRHPQGHGPSGPPWTIDHTAGCGCEQIIDALHLGAGHRRYGCSGGAMQRWVDAAAGR